MKILFSPFSPYVRKCLVTAHELGIKLTLLPSNAHPVNRDREIIAINPLGKVPTFFTDDGQVLYDSRVICEYLDHLGGGRLLPQPSKDRWTTLTLLSLGDGMLDAALLARYETVARPEERQWKEWREAQLDKIETSLTALNAHPEWLQNRVDLGSIAIGCALWYLDLRFADYGWRERHPEVAAWYATYSQRESMQQTWALPE
jgi:glutathione S-transferase